VHPDDYDHFVNQLYGKVNRADSVTEMVRINGVQYPLYVRSGTPDAVEIVHSVIRETYGKYLPDGDVKFVIDAGAYIGDTAAWYLSKFPASRIVALEPNPDSFAMLEMNCAAYGERARVINGALWFEDGELDLVFDPTTPTGNSVAQHETLGTNRCAAFSLNTILEQAGADEIDILKVDIEGAELELFCENPDPWLSRTRYITMEIHSPEAYAAVLAATQRHGFARRRYHELFIFHKK
jgi:FkbM family methyltransferase